MDAPHPGIRPGRAADAPAMAALCTELGYASTAAEVRERLRRLDDIDHGLFVSEAVDGRLDGLLDVHVRMLLEEDPFAEICVLVVTEAARGAGIGSALLAEAARWTREHGLTRLWVRVNVQREATHRFYEALGCRLDKQQRVYACPL